MSTYPATAGVSPRTPIVVFLLALGLAVALTAAGAPVLLGLAAVAVLILFVQFAAVLPAAALGASILGLGLGPFLWGYASGVAPKIFVDEVLLLLYLMAIPFLYVLVPGRCWHTGFGRLYWFLFAFLAVQGLSFGLGLDFIALRNFLETFALGAMLLVLFLQEGYNTQPEKLVPYIVVLTVALSVFQVIEKTFDWNPLWKGVTEFIYLSPEIARATGGSYRPYATFFSPSEAGTFTAVGLPFALWAAKYKRSKAALAAVAIIIIGLAVNGTRGVWLAVALIIFASLPNVMVIAGIALPVLGLAAWAGYLVFQSSPFVQRLVDPSDVLIRFQYWGIAVQMLKSHWLTGIGHMQFGNVYLNYLRDVSGTVDWDVRKIFVADNAYLTTTVEHGVFGLGMLLLAIYLALKTLRRARQTLLTSGNHRIADLIRCVEAAIGLYAVCGLLADVQLFTKTTKYIFILTGLGLALSYSYAHGKRITNPN